MKKILALVAVLLALGTVAFFYFQNENKYGDAAPIENSIPSHFPIALETENWNRLFAKLDTLSYGEAFNAQDWYIGSKIHVNYLKSLLNTAQLSETVQGKGLIAFGNAGNSQLGLLIAQQLPATITLEQILTKLKAANIEFSEHTFENESIITLKNFEGINQASFAIYQGLLLCSFKPSFVEEAMLSIQNTSSSWSSLNESITGLEDAKLYFKPSELNYLAGYFLKTNASALMNSFEAISGNSLFQLNFFKNELSLNGYAMHGSNTLIDTLKAANPADNYWLNLLPSNTAFHKMIGFGEKGFNTSELDLKTVLNEVNGSITLYTLESFNETLQDRRGALLPVYSKECLETFQSLDSAFMEEKKINDYNIYKTRLGDIFNKAFQLENYFDKQVYVVAFNDYLIVSSNIAVIEQYINALNQNDLMQSYPVNMDFKSALASKTNLDLYANLTLLQPYLSNITTENTWQKSIAVLNMQYANIGDKTFCQGIVRFKTEQSAISKNLWATSLDTLAEFKPQLVKNHNTNEQEILVQDLANNLYLLNTSGNVQWKIAISGKIQGDIYQIDYYNNRKLQYVFNTETKIYVVDRNGDNVDGFPISLPSKASNEMLVINYDNAGKYRYMVACDNGNIYGYEQNGSPLAGWSPLSNVGIVKEAIQHQVIGGKDYIFFNNDQGRFYALNRKGEERFPSVNTSNGNNNFAVLDKVFIGGDQGIVSEIDLTGKLKTKTILDSSYVVFHPAFSILEDTKAYAFAAAKDFKFQLSQWKNFASYQTPKHIERMESLVNNNNLWFILYTSDAVYLIDEIGNLHPDFPVATKGAIRLVYLIEGKDRILLYCDTEGKVQAKEIKWTN